MTCIVGLIDRGKVYMGGDSLGVGDYDCVARKDTKVFRTGDFLIGWAGSFRMGQLLQYAFTPPPVQGELHRYMVIDFCNAARQCFKEGGVGKIVDGVEEFGDSTFIVGHAGRLFVIEGDFQVGENRANYAATGCGRDLALGALHALAKTRLPAKKKVLSALSAAETFSSGVRRPFKVLCQ